MKLGVLTSGGDAPGMNAAIRAAVRCGTDRGFSMAGVRRGYRGLIEGDIIPLDNRAVGGIIERGGTLLRTSRSSSFLTPEGQRRALHSICEHELNGLIVIGGNGSLRGVRWLGGQGVATVGIPSSIDNVQMQPDPNRTTDFKIILGANYNSCVAREWVDPETMIQ